MSENLPEQDSEDRLRAEIEAYHASALAYAAAKLPKIGSTRWSAEQLAAGAILKACRQAMPPSAKLIIIERLLPQQALDDAGAMMIDLHMMLIHDGRVRTLEEIETLLSQVALTRSKVHATGTGLSTQLVGASITVKPVPLQV